MRRAERRRAENAGETPRPLMEIATIKPRVLTTAIDLDDGTASLELAMDVAGYFELAEGEARTIAAEVGRAVGRWRKEAAHLGLTLAEIDRMASAFEHGDLKSALSAR